MPATLNEVVDASGYTQTHMESNGVTTANVIELCQNHLNVNLDTNAISVAHRLRSQRNEYPPIILRFVRRSD